MTTTFKMKPEVYHPKKLKNFRQYLRRNMTPAEVRLWSVIKGRKVENRKFRRQHSIGPYIVDFYCPEEELVIELDGDGHSNYQNIDYDTKRQEYLAGLGMAVLRFENQLVFTDTENVLECIRRCFKK